MSGHALRQLTALGIVISTSACDNVEWGGVDVRLVPSPEASIGTAGRTAEPEATGSCALPTGAVLYMATRDSSGVFVIPVGEIAGDSLLPFRDERSASGYRAAFARELMAPGTRFTLFSAGARVGTLTVRDVGTDESFCTPRPRATGPLELVPDAVQATRFLALPESSTRSASYQEYSPLEHNLAQRTAGIDIATELIPQIGAAWPSSIVDARRDIAAFRLADGRPAVSTTFLFSDEARIQPAQAASYALYLMATPEGNQYRPAYFWYREARREGKGVPRYFQHLDWDGDGETEVLLEVLGERFRWTAVIQPAGDGWTRTFEDPCGAAAPPVQARTGD